jgi:hypothetical protein
MTRTEIEQLTALMDEERAKLLRGDLRGVTVLTPQKERLAARLAGGTAPADPGALAELGRAARRNAALLAAAIGGVKAARARLAAARHGAGALDIYDQSGQRQKVGAGPARVERRA